MRFILDVLCALDNAVEHILKCCAYPNDRYELERGGISRTMAYREYYRAENAILRSVVSDREYAEHAVKYNQLSEYKKKYFVNNTRINHVRIQSRKAGRCTPLSQ